MKHSLTTRIKRGVFAALVLAGFSAQASDGTKRWSREWGSTTSDLAYAVAVDAASNVYVAGGAYGGFDGHSNEGSRDVFLSKFLPDGTRLLSAMWGSAYDDYASGVAVDAAGYIYLAGGTYGEFDGQSNAGKNDAFLTKCAPDGTRVWTRIWGTATNDSAYDVAVDAATNIYVSGFTHGALDGQIVTGARDAFVTKFTPDGSRQWSRLVGSSGNDNAYAVAVDGGGSVYVTGGVNESGGTESDMFLAKFTATGVSVWSQVWGSTSYDEARGVEIDAASNIFVAGFTDGSLDGQTSSGLRDAFLSKVLPDGTRVWTRQWGSASNDAAYDIALDRAGYIYVSGNTEGAFDGQTIAGKQDVFLSQVAPDGTRIWNRIVGSVSNDYAQGMTCDAGSNVYVTGFAYGAFDGQANAGYWDAFLTRFGVDNSGFWFVRTLSSNVLAWQERWGGAGMTAVPGDYDGDGRSDFAMYSESAGSWYIWSMADTVTVWGVVWGGTGLTPVSGDFNGDGISDLAVYDETSGNWYIRAPGGTVLGWQVPWGGPGLTPVSGDFDGDSVADLALYQESTGNWFIRTMNGTFLAWAVPWGGSGLTPVSGDYDGNGASDLAVYDTATGMWFIRSLTGTVLAWGTSWGGSGMTPVSGDYTGDGLSDMAVYHETTGAWFILSPNGQIVVWNEIWGGAGFTPVPGDYDGDGVDDLAAYQELSGD